MKPSEEIKALALMARDAPDRLTLAQIKQLAAAVLIREAERGRMVVGAGFASNGLLSMSA